MFSDHNKCCDHRIRCLYLCMYDCMTAPSLHSFVRPSLTDSDRPVNQVAADARESEVRKRMSRMKS